MLDAPGRRRGAWYTGARRASGCWARLSHRCGGDARIWGCPVHAACERVCGSGGGTCTGAAAAHGRGDRGCSGAAVSHRFRRVGQGGMRRRPPHVGASVAPVHLGPRRSRVRSASPGHRAGPSWGRSRSPAGGANRLRRGVKPSNLGAGRWRIARTAPAALLRGRARRASRRSPVGSRSTPRARARGWPAGGSHPGCTMAAAGGSGWRRGRREVPMAPVVHAPATRGGWGSDIGYALNWQSSITASWSPGVVGILEICMTANLGIASGESVKTAFQLGISAVKLHGLPDDNVPRLHVRVGVSEDEVLCGE